MGKKTAPGPPTAQEIEVDLRRQLDALGISYEICKPLEDRVYEAILTIAKQHRRPVGVTEVADMVGVWQSAVTRICQRMARDGRIVPIQMGANTRRFQYVPRVV